MAPIPKFHGKQVRAFYAGYDLSGDNNKVEAGTEFMTGEVSAFGDANKNYVVGQGANSAISFDGFFNTDAARMHAVGTAYMGSETAHIFTAVLGTAVPGIGAFAGSALWTSLAPPLSVGNAAQEMAKFMAGGAYGVDIGQLLEYTPSGASGTGATYDAGALSSAGMRAYLNTLGVTGTATIKIQHSTTGTSAWADLITFAVQPSIGDDGKAVTGTVNRYLRRNITVGSANAVIVMRRL